jgi:sodium-dependent phosphate cotransporter
MSEFPLGHRTAALGPPPDGRLSIALKVIAALATLYVFLVSISLLGAGFKMFGAEFAQRLIATTSNPFVGLFIGILATSIVQSSSTTTCTVVGFVATGILSIENAIPIVMGANIGTTVTSTIVSLGHVGRKEEFRRAMAAATVHDFFNIIAVAVLFPLEIGTGFLRKSATALSRLLVGSDPVAFASPVKAIVKPVSSAIAGIVQSGMGSRCAPAVAVLAFALLIASLYVLVRLTRRLAIARAEVVIDRCMGRGGVTGIAVGAGLTAVIQSSSVTTSLMVPLAGSGIAKLEQIFPVTLGANVGTTVTALLASLSGEPQGLAIALVHLLFNVAGILLIYPYRPIRLIPMRLATGLAEVASRSRRYAALFIIGAFYALPALAILIDRLL